MPLYKEIAGILKERIIDGEYLEGEPIPDQESLAVEFNTSRITIRKAIQLLIDEGLVYTRRGSGTYVKNHIKHHDNVTQMNSQFGTTLKESGEVTSKILKFDVRFPNEHEMELLLLKKSDPVYELQRVRYSDGTAKSIESSIMPIKLITGLDEEILLGSIYNYIRTDLGFIISAARRTIIASKADDLDAAEFGIASEEPVLEVNQLVFFDDGTPFEISKTRYPYTSGIIEADIG
ncbi:GntR family transcriptional regulator [Enterococcus sp.]|uniref:GntR family transcriptional regulator n=1 Tax=Enterococcus sp. TaxID=35783 RepID=UPI003C71E8C3